MAAWAALIPAIVSLASMFKGGSDSSGSGISGAGPLDPQIMEMLNEQRMRMRLQNPLYEEATQLMRSLMPRGAKPASYMLPGAVNPEPAPLPDRRIPEQPPPGDRNPRVPKDGLDGVSQAVQMMASGISPIQRAQLFRR